jgi:hypothetical protein
MIKKEGRGHANEPTNKKKRINHSNVKEVRIGEERETWS